jgi:hypothetical protein
MTSPVKLVAVEFLGWSPLKRGCRLDVADTRDMMLALGGSWGGRELRGPSGSSTSSAAGQHVWNSQVCSSNVFAWGKE